MEIYATELAGYRRDTRNFKERKRIRFCKRNGITRLSKVRVDAVQIAASLSIPVLAVQAFV